MDPLTIGIAIAGAKKLVETCSDIKDLSGSLEHLFSASEAKPKKKISHNQKVLQERIKKAKANKIEAAEREEEMMDKILYWLIEACKVVAVMTVLAVAGYFLWQTRCTGASC